MKNLSELSPEELGKLFPIKMEKYNPEWKSIFQNEKHHIQNLLSHKYCGQIVHFGSTAIPGILAKPTIDILVEIINMNEAKLHVKNILENAGYHHIPRNDSPPPYSMFVKGYSPEGFKGQTFHLHCAPKSHKGLWNRIYFRDYLIKNPQVAKDYEQLKISLVKKFQFDRDGYTNAKTAFVELITQKAIEELSI